MTSLARTAILEEKKSLFGRKQDARQQLELRSMKWFCQETGHSISLSITEPMNKPVFCTSCGKKHLYTPGSLSDEDANLINELRDITREEDTLYYLADQAEQGDQQAA